MADGNQSNRSGPSTMIFAVVALILVAGLAVWFTTRSQSTEKHDATTTSAPATAGDNNSDVNLTVDLPDSVSVTAH